MKRRRESRARPHAAPRAAGLGYRPALDGVRAFAVLSVMSWHFVLPGLKGGFLGVDVFFVLSGFLITTLLVEEWEARGAIGLGRFYMRRVLRLFPALLVVLLVTAPLVPRLWTLEALFYVANWGVALGHLGVCAIKHLWSLSIEEQFYLVWPVTLLILLRMRAPRAVIYGTVALLALGSTFFKTQAWTSPASWIRLFHGTDSRADQLLIGCGLGLFLRWSALPERGWFRTAVRVAAMPALAYLAFMFLFARVYWEFLYHQAGFTGVALATAVMLLQMMTGPYRWMTAILEWGPLVAIGRISYGLYLWHQPIGWLSDPRHYEIVPAIARIPLLLVRFGLTFAMAGLSYALIERPALRLKHRFSPRMSQGAPEGPVPTDRSP